MRFSLLHHLLFTSTKFYLCILQFTRVEESCFRALATGEYREALSKQCYNKIYYLLIFIVVKNIFIVFISDFRFLLHLFSSFGQQHVNWSHMRSSNLAWLHAHRSRLLSSKFVCAISIRHLIFVSNTVRFPPKNRVKPN